MLCYLKDKCMICFFIPENNLQPSAHPFGLKASIFIRLDCRLFKTGRKPFHGSRVGSGFGCSRNPITVGITLIFSSVHLCLRSEVFFTIAVFAITLSPCPYKNLLKTWKMFPCSPVQHLCIQVKHQLIKFFFFSL